MSSGTKRGSDEPSAEGGQKKSKQTSLLSLFSGTAAGSTNISSTACSNTNSPPAPAAQQSSGGGANALGTDTYASDAAAPPAAAGLPAAPDAGYHVHYSTVDADDEGSIAGGSDDEESVTEPGADDPNTNLTSNTGSHAVASAENSAASTMNASVSIACLFVCVFWLSHNCMCISTSKSAHVVLRFL